MLRSMNPLNLLAVSLILSCMAFPISLGVAADPPQLQTAPVNPEFNDFMLQKRSINMVNTQGKSLGYIPSPVDRSYLKSLKKTIEIQTASPLPSIYDLRTSGKLTPVRDQGNCGSCWSFGAMASMESSLLTAETRDFSENNMKNTHGYDWGPCDGGNMFMSTGYLMRWSGPVNEADDPYQPNTNPSPSGLTVQKHSQNIIHLPMRGSSTENDVIKNALVTYGAVTVSYFHDNAFYNSIYHTYYYTDSTPPRPVSNHEVAIVGWDDNFDRNRFSPNIPPGNGAFIVKNSWGTSWGESGYFYISYYDEIMGYEDLAVFTKPERTTNYARMYSYDPLGVVNMSGFNSPTAWFANIFTAQGNDRISAVSFYNYSPNSPYELYVYRDLTNAANPRTGTLLATKSGTLADPGYLTIRLGSSVSVTAGQTFSVVVKLTTPGFNWPIPAEYAYPGYSSSATASPGQSFYSETGTSWTDMTSVDSTANVCLKAYSSGSENLKDFNGDGLADILWQNTSTEQLAAWFMNGINMSSAVFLNPTKAGEANWRFVDLGDINGDGKTDLLWQNNLSGDMVVWYMDGVNLFGSSYLTPMNAGPGNTSWKAIAVGDFKGPSGNDILWQNSATEDLALWYMNGATMTNAVMLNPPKPGADNWKFIGLGDFNIDGETDILWQNSVTGHLAVWYMNGITMTGAVLLNPASAGPGNENWKAAAVGDYNLDGKPDVLWQNIVSGDSVVWFMDGINLATSTALNPSSAGNTDWKIKK